MQKYMITLMLSDTFRSLFCHFSTLLCHFSVTFPLFLSLCKGMHALQTYKTDINPNQLQSKLYITLLLCYSVSGT